MCYQFCNYYDKDKKIESIYKHNMIYYIIMGNIISWNYESQNKAITHNDFKSYQNEMNIMVSHLKSQIEDMSSSTHLISEFKEELNNFCISINDQNKCYEMDNERLHQKIKWLEEHISQLDRNINNVGIEDKHNIHTKMNELNQVISKININMSDYLQIRDTVRDIQYKVNDLDYKKTNKSNELNDKLNDKLNVYDSDTDNEYELSSDNDDAHEEDKNNKNCPANNTIIGILNDENNISTTEENRNIVTDILYGGSNVIYESVTKPIIMIGNALNMGNVDKSNVIINNVDSKSKYDPTKDPLLISPDVVQLESSKKKSLFGLRSLMSIKKKETNKNVNNDNNNDDQNKMNWNDDEITYYYKEKSSKPI